MADACPEERLFFRAAHKPFCEVISHKFDAEAVIEIGKGRSELVKKSLPSRFSEIFGPFSASRLRTTLLELALALNQKFAEKSHQNRWMSQFFHKLSAFLDQIKDVADLLADCRDDRCGGLRIFFHNREAVLQISFSDRIGLEMPDALQIFVHKYSLVPLNSSPYLLTLGVYMTTSTTDALREKFEHMSTVYTSPKGRNVHGQTGTGDDSLIPSPRQYIPSDHVSPRLHGRTDVISGAGTKETGTDGLVEEDTSGSATDAVDYNDLLRSSHKKGHNDGEVGQFDNDTHSEDGVTHTEHKSPSREEAQYLLQRKRNIGDVDDVDTDLDITRELSNYDDKSETEDTSQNCCRGCLQRVWDVFCKKKTQ